MGFPFLDRWRSRRDDAEARAGLYPGGADDPGSLAEMLGECALLRGRVADQGLELDDTPDSLSTLDQLPPRWRDDPQEAAELGHDAGLYLGSVIVASVPGANWELLRDGRPFVRLPSGREIDVAAVGRDWAAQGAPSLWQVYSEADEG